MPTMPGPPAEEPLLGGLQAGRVVRVGDTVRRASGPWTATIQALLHHLRGRGFPAPEPLGLDSQGREVVSFLPGEASNHPWPAALIATDGARQIGAILRAYHQAVADFTPPRPAVWRHGAETPVAGQIVLHGDFGPHNLIWTGKTLTGVIDFELARPGLPIEDAGFAVIRAAQLRPDAMALQAGFERPPDRRVRLAAFADGYGWPPADLITQLCAVQTAELTRIVGLGGAGVEPWATFLRMGLATQVETELRWLEDNLGTL